MRIVVDLDDTLCNLNHRRKYYGVDWKKYNELMMQDTVIVPTYNLVKNLSVSNSIIILTGRYESYRNLIEYWLSNNNIKYDLLICKPEEDNESSVVYKSKWIRENCLTIDSVVIDDRNEIEQLCSELNITYIRPVKS